MNRLVASDQRRLANFVTLTGLKDLHPEGFLVFLACCGIVIEPLVLLDVEKPQLQVQHVVHALCQNTMLTAHSDTQTDSGYTSMNFEATFGELFDLTPAVRRAYNFMTQFTFLASVTLEEEVKYCQVFANLCQALWQLRDDPRAKLRRKLEFHVRGFYTNCYWFELLSRALALAQRIDQCAHQTGKTGQDMDRVWSLLRATIGILDYAINQALVNCSAALRILPDISPKLQLIYSSLRVSSLWIASLREPIRKERCKLLGMILTLMEQPNLVFNEHAHEIATWARCEYYKQSGLYAHEMGRFAQALCLLEHAHSEGWPDTDEMLPMLKNRLEREHQTPVALSHSSMRAFKPMSDPRVMLHGQPLAETDSANIFRLSE